MTQKSYTFKYLGSNTIGADQYLKETHVYLTGTYEPRTIFRTVANIAFDVYSRDPEASFFFIGASDGRDKSGVKNRRYQVYSNFVYDLDLSDLFEIHLVDFYSMCVLINRKAVPDMDAYMQRIIDFIV